jgi:hypothetical protein
MFKKTKAWWVEYAHHLSDSVANLTKQLEKQSSEAAHSRWEASYHFRMAAENYTKMKRCLDMLETVVNELYKAEYEGKDEKMLKDAINFMQLAREGNQGIAFLDYGEHAENIRKSGYNITKLQEYTQASLRRMRKNWGDYGPVKE